MEPVATRPRRNPIRRVIKAILHVIVKSVILTRRAILRYPIVALILGMMLVGGYLAIETGAIPLAWLRAPAQTSDGRPSAISKYLDGQKNGNIELMWAALDDSLKQDQDALATAERNLTYAKLNGITFTDSTYVGGSTLNDGSSVHLIVVSMSNGRRTVQTPWTFTLNATGKITNVE